MKLVIFAYEYFALDATILEIGPLKTSPSEYFMQLHKTRIQDYWLSRNNQIGDEHILMQVERTKIKKKKKRERDREREKEL